jgi:valyl-tRNA synthetase
MLDKYDRTIEEKWQKHWAETGTYKFAGLETGDSRPLYSIDTPPPFTSGELHMGHVLSYSFFDFVARYKRMRGFNVYYPQGWDTQGFPTEVKVEKKFGRLPPPQFREKCMEWTREFITKMRQQMNEMAFSPDWDYEYRTMEPDYHRKVQYSLIEMYKKKMVYRAEYPVYWCPSCASAIAKAELEDVPKDGTIYEVKFTGPNGEDLVIATTRPELMPACVAVLYHPEDERYKHLAGKKIKTALGKEVPVFADKEVEKEFGTGLLMVCTFGDKMDVVWMHRYKLPLIDAINKYGKMQNCGPELDGLKVADAKKKVVEMLEKEGKVVSKKPLKQTVKVHDRCKTAIELIKSMQWFIDIKNTGKAVKDLAHKVEWVPDFGISYLIDWVEGAEWDWVISRQRVFGTPIPFYFCEKCNNVEPEEESSLPFYAEKAKQKKCKCGNELKPETSTCDCWVDSSITPLIISGWPDDKEKFKKLYPVSLRPQGVEIVRTWAFYTIVRSGVGLTGIPPWKTILLNGNVLATDGKKMSKSLGNIISPTDLRKEYPTDAIRQWAALSGAMAKDRPFSYEDIKFAKSFLVKFWNAARFIEKGLEGYDGKPVSFNDLHIIDKWMFSRMNQVIKDFTEYMDKFEFHCALSRFHQFFWHEVCDNYLEYSKHRIYQPEIHGEDAKQSAQFVLYHILYSSLKLLAPLAPHITEEIYHASFNAKEGDSIHLAKWPEAGEADEAAVAKLEQFHKIISEIRQYKAKNKLAQNAELERIVITLPDKLDPLLISELKAVAKIKEIDMKKGEFKIEF